MPERRLRALAAHLHTRSARAAGAAPTLKKLLIANRGEIAVRIARGAREVEVPTVAIFSGEDALSLHSRVADESVRIETADGAGGIAAYLDIDAVIGAALESGADSIAPGYGFLSENAEFAARCEKEGIVFVGPSAEVITMFGDKLRAKAFAKECGVPVIKGSDEALPTAEAMAEFVSSANLRLPLMLKAANGGGGRGMRVVEKMDELAEAFERCSSEAAVAFGSGAVFVEEYLATVRHIEIQVLGDGTGEAIHLYERDCSVQRRNQKMIEIAPSRGMDPGLRQRMTDAALALASKSNYRGAGTVEFLLEGPLDDPQANFFFLEVNPRLQVEHTVTEQVTGVDLVQAILSICAGSTLADLGLTQDAIALQGFAIQSRVTVEPSAEYMITAYSEPTGPGVRVDAAGYTGLLFRTEFDPLIAKVITSSPSPDFLIALRKMQNALTDFQLEGVETNLASVQSMLAHEDFTANQVYTRFIADNEEAFFGGLLKAPSSAAMDLLNQGQSEVLKAAGGKAAVNTGVQVGDEDPLAVLELAASAPEIPDDSIWLAPTFGGGGVAESPDGTVSVSAPQQGTIVSVSVAEGGEVMEGEPLLIMNAMKMEHVVQAPTSGTIASVEVDVDETVPNGGLLLKIQKGEVSDEMREQQEIALDHIRPDLEEVLKMHSYKYDANRPEAVERRRTAEKIHGIPQRTARANVEDLVDDGSWIEYGSLVIAGQRRRRSLQDLRENTPADGMLAGLATVNADEFGAEGGRVMVLAYDYTVLAGTQGGFNHKKKDRMFEIAERLRIPSIFFAEGGGGRPGDTDVAQSNNLTLRTFETWGRLSGTAPMIGITSGYCFAGNAVILGTCDIIIATQGSNIGIGGPAMVEGGGIGVFHAKEIGPLSVHVPNGVVDIVAEDEAHAVDIAQKYLSYFQGPLTQWDCEDQRVMRNAIPENRLRVYDVRELIRNLADTDSVLELRPFFGLAMVTCLIRIEGKAMGVIANNCMHLSGAIDADAGDKATRFLNLCDCFDIPVLLLCDCPGFMVGIESEAEASVRHMCRMMVLGGSVTVPTFCVVTRKAYGLGAQGMGGGSHHAPNFTVAWPTGEFGGMGLEGSVKLGQRKELLAVEDL